jgi:hypothetical protein
MVDSNSAWQRTANVTSSRWPAIMLAKSRTARLSGRVTRMPSSSMRNTSGRIAFGTPGGMVAFLKYLIGPCDLMPMKW